MHVVLETLFGKGISKEHQKYDKQDNVFPSNQSSIDSDDEIVSSNVLSITSISNAKKHNNVVTTSTFDSVAPSVEFVGTTQTSNQDDEIKNPLQPSDKSATKNNSTTTSHSVTSSKST